MKKLIQVFTCSLLIGITSTQCCFIDETLADKVENLVQATQTYISQKYKLKRTLHTEAEKTEREKLEENYIKLCKNFKKCAKFIAQNPHAMKRKTNFHLSSYNMIYRPFLKDTYQEMIQKCTKKYGHSKENCEKALKLFYSSYCDMFFYFLKHGLLDKYKNEAAK